MNKNCAVHDIQKYRSLFLTGNSRRRKRKMIPVNETGRTGGRFLSLIFRVRDGFIFAIIRQSQLAVQQFYMAYNGLHHLHRSRWREKANPSDMMAIGDEPVGALDLMRADLNYLDRNGRASSRHQGKLNVVFCSGHVESPALRLLFADTSDAALSRWNRDHQPHRERLAP